MGSPPHTRDKYNGETSTLASSRIIPAYAGQMMVLKAPAYPCWDHPRIRGTNSLKSSALSFKPGSPPHTQDKSRGMTQGRYGTGIIPAYAGQMPNRKLFRLRPQDHPRIRGTNRTLVFKKQAVQGSSPHTRDKLAFCTADTAAPGIIPAYAGQMCWTLPTSS